MKKSFKKVLTNRGFPAIISHVVKRTTQTLATTAILENDTEKSHFVQENDTGAPEGATIVSNSQILNE